MNYEAEIKALKREIRILKQKELKEDWVSVSVITELTGRDHRFMTKLREQGLIKYRINKNGGYDYLLQSLNPIFIKNN